MVVSNSLDHPRFMNWTDQNILIELGFTPVKDNLKFFTKRHGPTTLRVAEIGDWLEVSSFSPKFRGARVWKCTNFSKVLTLLEQLGVNTN